MRVVYSIKNFFYPIFLSFLFACPFNGQLFAEGFLHGTHIKTPTGYVPIEQLKKHDLVICCDDGWSFAERPVIAASKKQVVRYIKIIIDDEVICAAADQKFYAPLQKKWVEAQSIVPGDILLSKCAHLVKVDEVIRVDKKEHFYTIAVSDYHNFCVSPLDIHVHNLVPAVAVGFSWAFGAGAIKFTGASLMLLGSAIGFVVSRTRGGRKAEFSMLVNSGGGGSYGHYPEDPDDKKKKRDETRNNHRPLNNKEARQQAKELGYAEGNPPFKTHGKPAFYKGNDWISPDAYGHKGGVWKRFTKQSRKGTYNMNLTKKIGT